MAPFPTAANSREEATLASVANTPYKFGWAFLLAWVFCVFYLATVGNAAGTELSQGSTALQIVFEGLPVFSSVATIALAVALEKRIGSPLRHKAVLYASPLIASLGTPFLSMQMPDPAMECLIFCLAAVSTGAGSGIMWIAWGEYYASIPQDEREIAAPASAVIAALLALASSSMSGWVGMAFAMSMPVISGTCLIWATKEAPLVDAGNSSASRERNADGHALSIRQSIASMGRTLPGIFVACVFVCIAGGFADHAGGAEISAQPVMLAALVFTIALAGAAIMGPRRISIPFFYRWMCPALVAGFGATVVFPGAFGAGVALTTSIAARFSFCLITQMFFARLADSGKITATQAFGWGWIAVHLGDFVGIVILIALSHPLETGALTLDAVAVASIIVLVTATMFVLDDTKSFGGFMDRAAAGGKNGDVAAKTPDSAEEGASILREERTDGHDAAGPTARNADESSERKADTAKEPDVEADGITRAASIGGDNACSTQKTEARTFDEVVASIARASRLTPRETQVFGLLARGRSIPYIRDELVISRETAATHAKHIYAKLDVHSRQELIDLVAREI